MTELTINDFYENEYLQYAYYDTYRKCASYVDGLKPSMRKVIYVIDKNNIKDIIKVSQLASKVSEQTNYLHGEQSLHGVIVNLSQNFPLSNNLNLLDPKGNFGSRLIPESAAARYIYTCKSKYFDYIFLKDDFDILPSQKFEGEEIEPRYYLPILPLILANGSEGIGNGYAQKIFPRKINDLIDYIKIKLRQENKKINLHPHFNGYNGKIVFDDNEKKVDFYGNFYRLDSKNIIIDELPYGYVLETYIKVLNELEEQDVIKNYIDYSEGNNFKFQVKIGKNFPGSKEKIIDQLKIKKSYYENYTCIDEDNKIRVFKDVYEIFDAYIDIRLYYYEKRRKSAIKKLESEIRHLKNKAKFVNDVVNDKIDIRNAKKDDLEKCLSNYDKFQDSYDYLLKMPVDSLTYDKIMELEKTIDNRKKELDNLKNATASDLWMEDIKKFEKIWNKNEK